MASSSLELLHAEVDRKVVDLARRHESRLRCGRGCSDCCVDGVTVFEVEAERIRRHHGELLAHGRPHAPGACAFLDPEGACRVYADRPYVCRTQGLPLRWLDEDDGGAVVELRDICPLNDLPDEPIETIATGDCWTIGPFEDRLAQIQTGSGSRARVALRDLFESA